jgi:hypothetical protein
LSADHRVSSFTPWGLRPLRLLCCHHLLRL